MSDHEQLLPPFPVPEDLALRAKQRGWPDGLLQRTIDLQYERELIERWLALPDTALEQFTAQLDQLLTRREQLEMGPRHARALMVNDAASFAALWDHSREEIGEWDLVVERRPNPFAQFRLQDDVEVIVVVERGVILASIAWAHRNVVVRGQELHVLYSHALRVHEAARRQGLSSAVRSGGRSPLVNRVNGEVLYFRGLNRGVVEMMKRTSPIWWKHAEEARAAGSGSGPLVDPGLPGLPVSVHQFEPRAGDSAPAAGTHIRAANRDDLDACAEIINATHGHLDFYEPVSGWLLGHRLDEFRRGRRMPSWFDIYGWEQFRVVERDGQVVACGGLWDRGRHMRERWIHRETGDENVIESTNVLDFGWRDGHVDAFAGLFRHFLSDTAALGRTNLVIHLDPYPELAELVADVPSTVETRGLQWRVYSPDGGGEVRDASVEPELPDIDLRYW